MAWDTIGSGDVSTKAKSMARSKKQTFSKIKAAKANARAVVGTPPTERILPDPKQKHATKPRYKETLADLLTPPPNEAGDNR